MSAGFLDTLDFSYVLDKNKMTSLNYDNICEPKYMRNMPRIVFLKAFMNFENHPQTKMSGTANTIHRTLEAYSLDVEKFAEDIKTELTKIHFMASTYFTTKMDFLVDKVQTIVGTLKPHIELDLQKGEKYVQQDRFIKDVLRELEIRELSLEYLIDFRTQIITNRQQSLNPNDLMKGIEESLKFRITYFIKRLPIDLLDILEYVKKNYDPARVDDNMTYIINYFNVFGELVGEEPFFGMLTKFFTGGSLKKWRDEAHPKFFSDPIHELYTHEPIQGPMEPVLKIDRSIIQRENDLHNIEPIIRHSKKYQYHPEWMTFFDLPKKENPFNNHKDKPETQTKIFNKGHKFIYYLYTFVRSEDLIPKTPASKNEIGTILYNKLITTNCYEDANNLCPLATLMSKNQFAKYYVPMLTLLKPFSPNPKEFTPEEARNIVNRAIQLGTVESAKHIPALEDKYPEIKNLINKEKTKDLADKLKTVNSKIMAATKEHEKDPLVSQQKHKAGLQSALPEMEDIFNELYPDITNKENPTVVDSTNLLNDLNLILDNADQEETQPGIPSMVAIIVKKKIDRIPLTELPFSQNKNQEPKNNLLIPEEMDSPLKRHEDVDPADLQTPIRDIIIKKLNDKITKDLIKDLTDSNGFIKYLDYTVYRKSRENANGQEFFDEGRYNLFRHYDLYVYSFLLKSKMLNQESIKAEIKKLDKYERIDINAIAKDEFIFDNAQSFLFMKHFIPLFSYFESKHVDTNTEKNREAKHVEIFNKIYKFLIDIRMNVIEENENPVKEAFNLLTYCMIDTSNYFEDGTRGLDLEEGEPNPCSMTFSNYSDIYYFMLIYAFKFDNSVIELHSEYMTDRYAINTHHLYFYIQDCQNSFEKLYDTFCTESDDNVCKGFNVFERISGILADNQGSTIADRSAIQKNINEHIGDLTLIYGKENASLVKVTMWNILYGFAPRDEHVGEYALLLELIDIKEVKGPVSVPITGLNLLDSELLTKYVGLKFHTYKPDFASEADQRIRSGVEHILSDKALLKNALFPKNYFESGNAKFLAQYCVTKVDYKHISDALITNEKISDMLKWTEATHYLVREMREETKAKSSKKDVAEYILLKLGYSAEQKIAKAEVKLTQVTSKPKFKTGVNKKVEVEQKIIVNVQNAVKPNADSDSIKIKKTGIKNDFDSKAASFKGKHSIEEDDELLNSGLESTTLLEPSFTTFKTLLVPTGTKQTGETFVVAKQGSTLVELLADDSVGLESPKKNKIL